MASVGYTIGLMESVIIYHPGGGGGGMARLEDFGCVSIEFV